MSDDTESLVLERTLNAPAALVWKMWADPEHFAGWYGPGDVTIPVARMDVRVGGSRLICMEMQTPNGPMQMWFTGEFQEVVVNERLVYTDAMSDDEGNIVPAEQTGMPESYPAVTTAIIDIVDLGDSTKMTLTHVGVPANSPGATGWNMALNKLVDYVTST
ncbi:MAG: SRPBCC domain-containing protein [Acidimicrobiales bacterium]|nr:SRPBCC domain-containing protein [Acidimicrobiales bacterium]MDG2217872.1 SRPBCC domain-containing protein [Acidimicrobiales bacterium]